MDDKLTLNEHERLTRIYTVRNANEKQVKKSMQNVTKYINIRNNKMTQRDNEIAAKSWGAWLNLTKYSENKRDS